MTEPMKQMRVPESVHEIIRAESKRTGRTMVGMLKVMVEQYINLFNSVKEKEGKDNG